MLWEQNSTNLGGKTLLYCNTRVELLAELHSKFCDTLSSERKVNLKECISRMILGASPPSIKTGMDRQLLDIIIEFGNETITAINPIARQAILQHHGQEAISSIDIVAEEVFSHKNYTNQVKGVILEKYILSKIELNKIFSFSFCKKEMNGLNEQSRENVTIEIKYIIHFTGKVPPVPFNRGLKILYIPKAPNYPTFDFFLWDTMKIHAFQVTTRNPFYYHPPIEGNTVNRMQLNWRMFCSSPTELGEYKLTTKIECLTVLEAYWIIPSGCIGRDSSDTIGNKVILLEDLQEKYPAVKKLNCQEQTIESEIIEGWQELSIQLPS